MRQQSLRQTANRYLKTDNRGSFKDKQHRAYVIHKVIDDLFMVGDMPASWRRLQSLHIQKLVRHWQQRNIQPATMMRYMTVIRCFLNSIDCSIANIDNESLGLVRHYQHRNNKPIKSDIWQTIAEASPRLIMALQIHFGLTFGEAIRFIPDIHYRDNCLWITREIAFNSEDRNISLRNDIQKKLILDLSTHTHGSKNLMQLHGYVDIRHQWRQTLNAHQLPTNKSYRYLYAQHLKTELTPILGNYQVCWLIREEMGIKSRNTLWLYLNE